MATFMVDEIGSTEEWTPDVTTAIRPEHSATPTENPVEDGSIITDHIIQQPDRLTVEAIVSNTPISEVDGGVFRTLEVEIPFYTPPFSPTPGGVTRGAISLVERGVDALFGGAASKPFTLQWLQTKERIKEAYDKLEGWKLEGKKLRVIDRIREYDSLVITGLTPSRSFELGDAATFTIVLQRINIVSTEIATGIPIPAEVRGAVKANLGQQSNSPTEVGETTKKSLLLKALQGVGVLDG